MCWCGQLLEGSMAMWVLCASPNQWQPNLNLNIIRTKRAWLERSLKPKTSTSPNPQSPHLPLHHHSCTLLNSIGHFFPSMLTFHNRHHSPIALISISLIVFWTNIRAHRSVGPNFCTIIMKPSTADHVDNLGWRLKWYNLVLYHVRVGPILGNVGFCVYCFSRWRESKEERKIPSPKLKY